jgi:hypothetical protein
MKSIKVLCIVIFVFSVAYLPGSYAEENFVTSEKLSVEDVDVFIAALAREEAGIGRGSYVTINKIIALPWTASSVMLKRRLPMSSTSQKKLYLKGPNQGNGFTSQRERI